MPRSTRARTDDRDGPRRSIDRVNEQCAGCRRTALWRGPGGGRCCRRGWRCPAGSRGARGVLMLIRPDRWAPPMSRRSPATRPRLLVAVLRAGEEPDRPRTWRPVSGRLAAADLGKLPTAAVTTWSTTCSRDAPAGTCSTAWVRRWRGVRSVVRSAVARRCCSPVNDVSIEDFTRPNGTNTPKSEFPPGTTRPQVEAMGTEGLNRALTNAPGSILGRRFRRAPMVCSRRPRWDPMDIRS